MPSASTENLSLPVPDNEKESVSLSGSEKVEVAMVEPTAVFSRNELKATDEDNDGASLASVTVTVIIFGTEKKHWRR